MEWINKIPTVLIWEVCSKYRWTPSSAEAVSPRAGQSLTYYATTRRINSVLIVLATGIRRSSRRDSEVQEFAQLFLYVIQTTCKSLSHPVLSWICLVVFLTCDERATDYSDRKLVLKLSDLLLSLYLFSAILLAPSKFASQCLCIAYDVVVSGMSSLSFFFYLPLKHTQ